MFEFKRLFIFVTAALVLTGCDFNDSGPELDAYLAQIQQKLDEQGAAQTQAYANLVTKVDQIIGLAVGQGKNTQEAFAGVEAHLGQLNQLVNEAGYQIGNQQILTAAVYDALRRHRNNTEQLKGIWADPMQRQQLLTFAGRIMQ